MGAQYRANDIRHIVALRGDMPSGIASGGEFRYASDLVRFIREETGDWFTIEVAAYPEFHPQARSHADDMANFAAKFAAGADSAITDVPSVSSGAVPAGCTARSSGGASIVTASASIARPDPLPTGIA